MSDSEMPEVAMNVDAPTQGPQLTTRAMDVELEDESRQEALAVLESIFPMRSRTELERALLMAGGQVERAVNQLSEPAPSQVDSTDCIEVVDVSAPPASSAAPVVAQLPTPARLSADPASRSSCVHTLEGPGDEDELAKLLQQICPHCSLDHIRQVLSECNNDPDIATERLLNGGAVVGGSSAAASSSAIAASVEPPAVPISPVKEVLSIGMRVEVKYCEYWYFAEIGSRNENGTYHVVYEEDRSWEDVERDRIKALLVGMRIEVDYEDEWRWAEIQGVNVDQTYNVCYEDGGELESNVSLDRCKKQACIESEARLQKVLPDCDPMHLQKVLKEAGGNENTALEKILSADSYPKISKIAASSSSGASSSTGGCDGDKPPEGRGEDYWFDLARQHAGNKNTAYHPEARQLLLDEFCELRQPGICKILENCNSLYAPAWKQCYEAVGKVLTGQPLEHPLAKLKCPRKPQRSVETLALKSVRSLALRQELEFVRWWRGQGKKEEERQQQQKAYFAECEANGLLLECECCFAEEIPEQTIQCAGGHLFCGGCARRYVETQLSGEGGVPKLTCTSTSGCREQLPRSELARVLPEALLTSFDSRLQKASIEAAILQGALADVEKCPFCDFVMQMEVSPEENKIFVCLSESCGKESCRLCKEENHIPLKCSEVEKNSQVGHRLSVEESMSAALIRECPSCSGKGIASRFVKTDGCNKMTCPKCNGWVCYLCEAMIEKKVGYAHFCQHPLEPGEACSKCSKCMLHDPSSKGLEEIEQERVARAGLHADDSFRAGHAGANVQEQLQVLACAEAKASPSKSKAKAKEKAAAEKGKKRKSEEPPEDHTALGAW